MWQPIGHPLRKGGKKCEKTLQIAPVIGDPSERVSVQTNRIGGN